MRVQQLSTIAAARTPIRQVWSDWAGIAGSIGCALHCALMPFAIGYLPALGLSWLADMSFHRWMAGACFLLAVMAFGPGWKCHRRVGPALIGFLGIGLLAVGSVVVDGECCSRFALLRTSQGSEAGAAIPGSPVAQCDPTETPALAWMLTPLGGALLVVGHVANQRCRCTVCQSRDVYAFTFSGPWSSQ
jgi:hypothetical protein